MQVTIDAENNVWVTDVAMHQVFQFPPYGGKDKMPNIVLGKPVRTFLERTKFKSLNLLISTSEFCYW